MKRDQNMVMGHVKRLVIQSLGKRLVGNDEIRG